MRIAFGFILGVISTGVIYHLNTIRVVNEMQADIDYANETLMQTITADIARMRKYQTSMEQGKGN